MTIFKRILGVILVLLMIPAFCGGFVMLVDDSQSFFQNFIFSLICECAIILGLLLIYILKLIICWCFDTDIDDVDPDSY